MRTYDITLTISPDLVVWPSDPQVEFTRTSKISEGANANVTHMKLSAHTGTHVDAPFHFVDDGDTVENLSLDLLVGRAYVLHLPEADLITLEMVKNSTIPPRTKRVLFRTKNSEIWNSNKKTFQKNFVSLSAEAAEYLVARGVKLIGIDYLSIAPFGDSAPTHEILLKSGVIVVEGLNLSEVSQGRYTLYCFPLKLEGLDGSPARAVLFGV